MLINIKKIFVAISVICTFNSLIINGMDTPPCFILEKIENKTGKNLKILDEKGHEIVSTGFPKKLIFLPGKSRIMIYLLDTDNQTFSSYLDFNVNWDKNLINLHIMYRSITAGQIFVAPRVFSCNEIPTPNEFLLYSIILEGSNLEQSKIEVIKRQQPHTLRKQSIKTVADKIKRRELTLEEAKRIIPLEVYQELLREL